jgi:hypothetical protein
MSWLSKLFPQSRTRKVASGALPLEQLLALAQGWAASQSYATGANVIAVTVANTNSMIPTLDNNCVILLEKVVFEALSEGDIVRFRGNPALWGRESFILHRLNERTARGWWPLGDGNTKMDPEVVTPENFDRRVCGILYARRLENTDL